MFAYDDAVMHPCSACGATNRFPRSRAFEHPKCGACAERIFPERPLEVAEKKFLAHVEQCPIPVLVYFRTGDVEPLFETVAAERAGRLKLVTLDVRQSPILAGKYGVFTAPALQLFVDGRAAESLKTIPSKSDLDALLDRWLPASGVGAGV